MSSLTKTDLNAINLIADLHQIYGMKEVDFETIKRISKLDHQAARDAVKVLFQSGYLKEIFRSDLGIIKGGESKSEIKYRVTPAGAAFATEHRRRVRVRKENERRLKEYEAKKVRREKSDKRLIIFCIVGFVVMLTIAILVALSLG